MRTEVASRFLIVVIACGDEPCEGTLSATARDRKKKRKVRVRKAADRLPVRR